MGFSKKILLIDDEKDFLSLLKDTLEIRDFEVAVVDNAVEAGMEFASKPPDLILMDIKMPGIDGLQAASAIRRNPSTKNIPIIVVSALSGESVKKEARKLGVAEYFVKPVDIEKLIRKIKEILE